MNNLHDSDGTDTQPCRSTENPRKKSKKIRSNEVVKYRR